MNTQRRQSTFNIQVAQRNVENLAIDAAFYEILPNRKLPGWQPAHMYGKKYRWTYESNIEEKPLSKKWTSTNGMI